MSEKYSRTNIKEIDLKEYFVLLKRRLWIIVVIATLTTLAGYYYSANNYTPVYETSTRMILGSEGGDMSTLMVMIKDPIIMEKVREGEQLSRSPESIANQITVSRVDDSQVVQISVIDSDPEIAAKIANSTALSYKSEIVNILGFTDVQLLSEAKVSSNPINESTNRITIIALVFGLIVGIGFIFLLDSLDAKVRKESEVESLLGVPVLGTISNMNKKRLVMNKNNQKETKTGGEKVGIKQNA